MGLFNLPQRRGEGDYEAAIQGYVAAVSKHREVRAVYRFGQIGVPGISDVDLLVVFDADARCAGDYSAYGKLGPRLEYVFMHDVFVVPSDVLGDLNYLAPVFDIELVHGQGSGVGPMPEDPDLRLMWVNDLALVYLSGEFEAWRARPAVNVRLLLARLNALKYPIGLVLALARAAEVSVPDERALEDYTRSFAAFRSVFFEEEAPEKRLRAFVDEACVIARQLVALVDQVNHALRRFECRMERAQFRVDGRSLGAPDLPGSLFANLHHYARARGPVSDHIRANARLDGMVSYEPGYLGTLARRIPAVNRAAAFRKANAIAYGGLSTFGAPVRPGLPRRVLRKLHSWGG